LQELYEREDSMTMMDFMYWLPLVELAFQDDLLFLPHKKRAGQLSSRDANQNLDLDVVCVPKSLPDHILEVRVVGGDNATALEQAGDLVSVQELRVSRT
jgi:hypothetical protein